MSSNEVPTRETAKRVFASEFNDSHYTFKESEDERAPVYQLLQTGEQANRIFFIGTLTEKSDVGEEDEYWQGRIADPTDTFFVYAGQYQPEAAAVLRSVEAPAYLAVVGKPRTYENDNGDIIVSVRPESINVIDGDTRDRWVIETAEQTIDRIEEFDPETNQYDEKSQEVYGSEVLSDIRSEIVDLLMKMSDTEEHEGESSEAEVENETDAEEAAPTKQSESAEEPKTGEESDDTLGEFNDEAETPDDDQNPTNETDGGQTAIADTASNT